MVLHTDCYTGCYVRMWDVDWGILALHSVQPILAECVQNFTVLTNLHCLYCFYNCLSQNMLVNSILSGELKCTCEKFLGQ